MKCRLMTAHRPTTYSVEYSVNGVITLIANLTDKYEIDSIIDELSCQSDNFHVIRRFETKGRPYTVVC